MLRKGSYTRALVALALIGLVPFADLAASALSGPAPTSTAGVRHGSRHGVHRSPVDAPAPVAARQAQGRQAAQDQRRVRATRARERDRRIAKHPRKHFVWPTRRRITSRFGWRRSPVTGRRELHGGTDLACALGSRVLAPKDGRVLLAGRLPVYGQTVVIRHQAGWVTFMSHMRGLAVGAGQRVRQGQRIGSCGASGWATGPHVHFELRRPSGRSIDPRGRMWRGRRR